MVASLVNRSVVRLLDRSIARSIVFDHCHACSVVVRVGCVGVYSITYWKDVRKQLAGTRQRSAAARRSGAHHINSYQLAKTGL